MAAATVANLVVLGLWGGAGSPPATPPTITSSASVSVNEGVSLSHALTADESVTWSIVGGADAAQAEISSSTLRWASDGTQDYETPADADTNNTYVVTVRATSTGTGATADQTITITVLDVDESAVNVNFGVRTRKGYGGYPTDSAEGATITGTGSADWAVDADGNLVPSGTYGAAPSFSKSAGETYNLTIGAQTFNVTLVANAAHARSTSADTSTTQQIRTYFNSASNISVGNTIYLRDDSYFNPTSADWRIRPVANGYPGHGTISGAGTGYATGSYTVVSLTGGSGSGAKANITVNGSGVVTVVSIQDPGLGYVAGDVLSANAADLGGSGSGFAYTVIDLSAMIVVASETADTSIDADGNYARGGSAKIGAITFDSAASGNVWFPVRFEDVSFYYDIDGSRSTFMAYATSSGYGVSALRCRFENGPNVSFANQGVDAFALRDGTVEQCYFTRLGVSVPGGTSNNWTGLVQKIVECVSKDCVNDGYSLSGNNLEVRRNFQFNINYVASTGRHTDGAQHGGFRGAMTGGSGYTNGTYDNVPMQGGSGTGMLARIVVTSGSVSTITCYVSSFYGGAYAAGDVLTINASDVGGTGSGASLTVTGAMSNLGQFEENIFVRNVGTADGDYSGGIFFDDSNAIGTYSGASFLKNIVEMSNSLGIFLRYADTPDVRFNLTASALNGGQSATSPAQIITSSAGGVAGTFTRNAACGISVNAAQTGATVSDNVAVGSTLSDYQLVWPNYVDGTNPGITNRSLALLRFTPANRSSALTPPGLVLADGTVAGPLFPAVPGETIGAWNDGSVYDPTNPVWVAAHPPAT